MIPVSTIKASALMNDFENADGKAWKMVVREYFLYSLLDFIAEGNLQFTMADVWRRMCYSRNILDGATLRNLSRYAQGMPMDFMWDWPFALYMNYWIGSEIHLHKRYYFLNKRDPKYLKWLALSFQEKLKSMRAIPTDAEKVNLMDFGLRCNRKGLNPDWVRKMYPEMYRASNLEGKFYYQVGALEWIKAIKYRKERTENTVK